MLCKFDKAWIGRCNKASMAGSEYCPDHLGIKCVVTGQQATHECDHAGQFVCGFPLSDGCIHTAKGHELRVSGNPVTGVPLSSFPQMALDAAIEIRRLNEELNTRCSEIIELKEKLSKQNTETYEWGKRTGYEEGYKAGYEAAMTNTKWNVL